MADRKLPNGQIVTGVPDDFSSNDLKMYALQEGLATEEDYNKDYNTNADYLSLIGELGGGLGGAYAGAAYGTAFGPLGTLTGGAIGAGVGYFLGEVGESYVEDRDFNVEKAGEEAIYAAATDAVFGAGFNIVGKALSKVWSPFDKMFSPDYIKGGNESEAARAALAIQRGDTTLENIVKEGNVAEEQVKIIQKNLGKRKEELEQIEVLNTKLTRRGEKLLPQQAVPEFKGASLAQDYAASSAFLSGEYQSIIKGQENFIKDSFEEILTGQLSKGLTRDELGLAVQGLVKDADKALTAKAAPLYRAIDKEGSVFLGTGTVKNNALRAMKASPSSSDIKSAVELISKLNNKLSPSETTKTINRLRSLSQQYTNPKAKNILKAAAGNLNNQLKRHKKLIRPESTRKLGTSALNELTKRTGESGILGAHRKIADKLVSMRDEMSFAEAHLELSTLKAMQRDAAASVGEKSSKAEGLINKAIDNLSKSMDTTAQQFNPVLNEKYKQVSDLYREGIKDIHGDWIVKAVNKGNPAQIGEFLVKNGERTSVSQLNKLINRAKSLGKDIEGQDLFQSIEREYLNGLFPTGTSQDGLNFIKNMNNEKFADTFKAIVGKEQGNKIRTLANEIDLMSKGIQGSEGATSLAIRGGEISTAKSPTVTGAAFYLLLGKAVKGQLSPENISKKIAIVKEANSKLAKGEKLSKGVIISLLGKEDAFKVMGLTTGALIPQE
mgnify:FL=1|tara:strand:+ start:1366 stop:3534 length:2169 start_codon:yes stop_codon:yes gene_type:complete